jgi:hypothetical protein
VSKLAAGREKDLSWVGALIRHGLVSPATLYERLAQTPLDEPRRQLCAARLQRLSA